jgi:integrase
MTKRTTNKLAHKQLLADIAKLRTAGATKDFGDGGGLWLIVTAAGRARFLHKFQWAGKPKERMFPGEFPDTISLADARSIRDNDRKLLRDGINPIVHNKAAAETAKGIPTFAAWASANASYLAPKSANARQCWVRQMTDTESDGITVGALAQMPIDNIGRDDVKAIIAPIWSEHPATAKELCGRIRRVLDHRYVNTEQDGVRVNPADFKLIERAIGRKFEAHPKSRASLPYQQVPAFLSKLALRPQISARALEMVIATGCRANEILEAEWREVDLKARTLTIPPERMKAEDDTHGEPHVIPLSIHMVRILRKAKPPVGARPNDLIFPNGKGKAYTPKEMLMHVKALAGEKPTTHGFRSSLKNWGTAMTHGKHGVFDRDLMDVCLAHKIGSDVSQAYLTDRWLERRRVVMSEWSRYCVPPSAVVLPFRRAA